MNKKRCEFRIFVRHSRNNKMNIDGEIRYIGEILLILIISTLSEQDIGSRRPLKPIKETYYVPLGKDLPFMQSCSDERHRLKLRRICKHRNLQECGADGWVVKAEKELATIS